MALQKQLVPLPIDKGLETKLDPKQEEIGYLRQAVNVVYETIKLLRKRNGYDLIDDELITGSSLPTPIRLSKYKKELLAFTETKLYAYSQTRLKWIEKGTLYPASTVSRDVYQGSTDQTQICGAEVEGFYIYTWKDNSDNIRYSVQDSIDGSFLVSNGLVAAGIRPHIGSINNKVFIFYIDGTTIKFKTFSILEPQTLSSATNATATVNGTNKLMDVVSCNERVYVAFNSNSVGSELALFYVTATNTVSSVLNIASQMASHALNITCDTSERLIISYSNGSTIRYTIYPAPITAATLAATTIETINNVVNCTVVEGNTAGTYKVYYEVQATNTRNNYIKSADLTIGGTVTNVAVFKRSVGLAATAFKNGTTTLISGVHDSDLQGTYFIFDESGAVVTKHQSQRAPGTFTTGVLTPVSELGDSKFFIPNEVKNRIEADGTADSTTSGVSYTILDLDPEIKYQNAELADALHICSGTLNMYDGATISEHGFHIYPEDLTQISPVPAVIATTTEGVTGVTEVQRLTYSAAPAAGTFTITIGAETTAAINWNDSNATIKGKLEALTAITTVTVTGSFATYHEISFDAPQGPYDQAVIGSNSLVDGGAVAITVTPTTITDGVLAVSEVQTLTFQGVPTAGTYTIDIDGETTSALNWSQGAPEIKTALEALPSITTVTVTGTMASGFTITFTNPVAPIDQLTLPSNSLTTVGTVGKMSNGNYGYVAVYKWTDNTGKDHRSAPTPVALNVILAGGTSKQAVVVRVPTLRVTSKSNVVIELYRTEDAGTTYYKVTSDLSPTANDTTVDYVDITDTLSDAELIQRELLYTTGGVLENIAAPACSLITVHGNRLAVVEPDSNRVWFSKINGAGEPVEFTDLIYRDVDPVGGTLSCILSLNEKLAVFEKDATFFITGDGPNNLGQQDNFSTPEIISSDIGCLRSASAVLTPSGIMFQSRKGIWQLTGGLELQYTGSNVEQFNDSVITSAKVIGELNQIRFITDTEIALVYNYNLNRWATFDNHGGLSSVVIENDYYYLREDGAVYKENRTSFGDNSSAIKMVVETGWLSLSALQGFQRIYHAMILGSAKSPHKLRVRVAYDFIDAWAQDVLIDTADFINYAAYGEDSPYGSGSPYGGSGNLHQMRVDFARQKCQAIKILIEDAQDEIGEGLSLSSITLRAGAKEGSNKLGAGNTYGTSS